MKKIIASFALAILLVPCFAFADGGMIYFDPYSDRWDFADETNQQAFINYEKGVEKMILSVGVGEMKEGKTMWIFPVPADPSKVAVDVVTKLPNLRGEEISQKAQSNLDDAKSWLQATQIYTIPFAFLGQSMRGASSMPKSTALSNSWGNPESASRPDVVVYEHLEKEGITSEIVTARTAQGFNDYFKNKGLNIDNSSIPVLGNYIGQNYSFVVSWMNVGNLDLSNLDLHEIISSGKSSCRLGGYAGAPCMEAEIETQKLINSLEVKHLGFGERDLYGEYIINNEERNDLLQGIKDHPEILQVLSKSRSQKGVFVSFPTEKIYFPLMPTSVYGSKIVPAEIRVLGHVTPDVFADIKSFTKTEYFWDESTQFDKELKAFYNGPVTDIKYTKIEINAPSKFFTSDLWMKNSAPLKTNYQLFFANQFLLVVFFSIVACSVLTGLLAGWLLFKEWRNREGLKKFGLVGLANCLTILGMIALILPSNTKKDSENAAPVLEEIKKRGYYWKKRLALGLIIADLPFLFISIFAIPFSIINLFNDLARVNYYRDFWPGDLLFIGLSMLPVIVLVAAWFLVRVKPEDKQFFADLKSKNYSSWTFQPKDRRKIWFIFLYSIFFLIISWVVVKLLVFSVGGEIIGSGDSGIRF